MTRSIYRPVRITPEEQALLDRIAAERKSTVSNVIRWAIKTALGDEPGRMSSVGMTNGAVGIVEAPGTAQ